MTDPAAQLVDHYFRHESGRLVAVLARVFGLRNLDLVEDMVQASLVEALQSWRTRGVPENPSGWIHTVARNRVLDALRHEATAARLAPQVAELRPAISEPAIDDLFLDSAIEDNQLRLIFACCHPLLPRENQIALTLKTLCGFSLAEIARGLLVQEEAVKKRLQRARQQLVDHHVELAVPPAGELAARLDSVHQVLYLLFNEGYAASSGAAAIRTDLCEEAVRLCHLLAGHAHCRSTDMFALLALMLFHAARLEARTDAEGRLLLLEEQDRSRWDHRLIERARQFLDRSAEGTHVSTYHLEAGIALIHAAAPSLAETDWRAIRRLYDVLLRLAPSPLYELNRAIAVAHLEGPAAAIALVQPLAGHATLAHYHLVDATLGELHRRAGDMAAARTHFERAARLTQSAADRELLARRIASCQAPRSEA
jgi:RNA polymerase sigma-70 factor (ECF subfamily)